MKTIRLRNHHLLPAAAGLLVSGAAGALPVELAEAQFDAAIAGLPTFVEDLERFDTIYYASPMALLVGSFSAETPVVGIGPPFCGDGSKCLLDASSIDAKRVFKTFEPNIYFWAADFHAIGATDQFSVTIVGRDGAATFTHRATAGFWGFADPAGILSVTFQNLGSVSGSGNYSFDNITMAVPEPGPLALLCAGAAGAVALRLRRRRACAAR